MRTKNENLKHYHLKIVGSEIYFYKPSDLKNHKIMHCLIGAFIKKMDPVAGESGEDGNKIYRLKIQIGNVNKLKSRIMYFNDIAQQLDWYEAIKLASGY